MQDEAGVRRAITLPVAPERVWEALTSPSAIGSWFGADATLVSLAPGAVLEFRWPDGRTRAAVLEVVQPPARLAFRWVPFERDATGAARAVEGTRVDMTLEPAEDGTRLTVVEAPLGKWSAGRHAHGADAAVIAGGVR